MKYMNPKEENWINAENKSMKLKLEVCRRVTKKFVNMFKSQWRIKDQMTFNNKEM